MPPVIRFLTSTSYFADNMPVIPSNVMRKKNRCGDKQAATVTKNPNVSDQSVAR